MTQEVVRERLIESRLTPNAISLTGFVLNLTAAGLILDRMFFLAGIAFIVGSIMDTLDGRYSRMSGKGTQFGAFLDSTLDRTGENLVYAGIAVGCAAAGFTLGVGLAALAMATASVVTYARARAEAVGLHGEVGIAPRPERLIVLTLGLVLTGFLGGLGTIAATTPGHIAYDVFPPAVPGGPGGGPALAIALGIITITCAITIVQRIVHVQRQASHH